MATTTFEVSHEVDNQLLADTIITAAVEGGIGYWSDTITCKWTEGPEHTTATVLEIGDGDENPPAHVITLDTIVKGIRRILSGSVKIDNQIHGYVALAVAENDAGFIDSVAADCIVQAGLFDELVYG